MIVAADLGGSNTKVLLADATGRVQRVAVRPTDGFAADGVLLNALLSPLDLTPDRVDSLIVTGGRHNRLGDHLDGLPLRHIDEIAAIGRGGLLAGGRERALVVSMGTGTAMVSAGPRRCVHAGGTSLGGGTLRGLGRHLLGATDHETIAALAATGDFRRADLTIGDLIGTGIGMLPPDMPASYLGRLANDEPVAPADIAAALLDMIGHVAGHLAMLTARAAGLDTVIAVGHMVEFPTLRTALLRFAPSLPGGIIIPPDPGLAIARGALAVAMAQT